MLKYFGFGLANLHHNDSNGILVTTRGKIKSFRTTERQYFLIFFYFIFKSEEDKSKHGK